MKESRLVNYCKNNLNLLNMKLGNEYRYSCLPLAIIDAVYSIRQSYDQTQKIVKNYCNYYGIGEYKSDCNVRKHTVSEMIDNIESIGKEAFAKDVLKSKNKTAGANPILKSEAVYQWAKLLRENLIEDFDDFFKADLEKLEVQLKKVHGQGEAVVKYFFMLCGNDDFCKPDRHLLNFLSSAFECNVKENGAQTLLEKTALELKTDYPNMTVRLLDYIIWNFQRGKI